MKHLLTTMPLRQKFLGVVGIVVAFMIASAAVTTFFLTAVSQELEAIVEQDMPLLWVLRDELNIKGPKYGCGIALCGACTVHLNGVPVRSCSLPVGAVTGEVYAIQRKFVDLAGITLGPDRVLGLAENRWENLMLANNNPLLDRQDEGSVEPYPDPKESWFEEVRIGEGSGCDDVLTAVDEGDLSRARPF